MADRYTLQRRSVMATIDWDAVFAAVEAKEGAFLERLRQIIRIDNCIPPGRCSYRDRWYSIN